MFESTLLSSFFTKTAVLAVASLVLVGCSHTTTPPAAEPVQDAGTTAAVPAPGFEDVEEMVVVEVEEPQLNDDANVINVDDAVSEAVEVEVAPVVETPAVEEPNTASQKTVNITAKQWEFSPSTVTVKKGTTVQLVITSEDVTHGFSLSAFGVNEQLKAGETTTVEFVADTVGTFSFFCNIFCGSGHSGMSGTLVVE